MSRVVQLVLLLVLCGVSVIAVGGKPIPPLAARFVPLANPEQPSNHYNARLIIEGVNLPAGTLQITQQLPPGVVLLNADTVIVINWAQGTVWEQTFNYQAETSAVQEISAVVQYITGNGQVFGRIAKFTIGSDFFGSSPDGEYKVKSHGIHDITIREYGK